MTVTQTPRLGINNWGAGTDPFTRAQANADHAQLELLAAVDVQGTHATRPASGVRGRYYYETDTGFLYRDTGSAWVLLNPTFPAIPAASTATPQLVSPGGGGSAGSSGLWSPGDHVHGAQVDVPASSSPGDTQALGVGSKLALSTHRHARENHGHAEHDGLYDAATLGGHGASFFTGYADGGDNLLSGRVAKFENPPRFRARDASHTSHTVNTPAVLDWNTVDVLKGGALHPTSTRFTAPIDGLYFLHATVGAGAISAATDMEIYLQRTPAAGGGPFSLAAAQVPISTSTTNRLTVADEVELLAGDIIEVVCLMSGSTAGWTTDGLDIFGASWRCGL